MGPMTLKRTLDPFVEDGMILKRVQRSHHLFKGNIEDIRFRYAKVQYSVGLLIESGSVESIKDRDGSVASITLFGSAAKGYDGMYSDYDLLVISLKKKDQKIAKIVDREVNVVLATPSEWALIYEKDRPFYDEVLVHGIALFGRKPVVR